MGYHPNNERIKKTVVNENTSIKGTMKVIDQNGLGITFVIDDDDKLVGVATDGDIRRAILRGNSLEKPIREIMNKDPVTVKYGLTDEKVIELVSDENVRKRIPTPGAMKIPILDDDGRVRDIAFLYESKKGEKGRKSFIVKPTTTLREAVKKVLVVGGAGYLGSVLCRKLLDRGYTVKVLDNLVYGDEGIKNLYENPNFEFIKGDMRNIQTVIEAIKGVDAVIHLAAIVGDPASAINPEETIEVNYLATKMLAEICRYSQVNRFIFASSCSLYGATSKPEILLTEESPLNPISLYAEMKLKSEQGILELMDENFSPTILRMATLYGLSPRMRFDLVVNLLTAKAVVDKKITIFGGNQWRPFIHTKDVTEAYIKCLEAPISKIKGKILNVGSNEQNYQISKIGEIIHKLIPTAKIIVNEKDLDQRDYNVSFDKICNTLGFEAIYTIEQGIKEAKDAIEKGIIENYKDRKYSNYESLSKQF